MRRLGLFLCIAAGPGLGACATQTALPNGLTAAIVVSPPVHVAAIVVATTPTPVLTPVPAAPLHTALLQRGLATWYGGRHAGRRTSSGERFDPRLMTAAHASLPLGSYVKVTVEDTGRTVVVRVNDREPLHGARVIDLSQGAASELGIVAEGRARVSIAEAEADEATAPIEVAEAPPPRAHRRRHGG